MGFRQEMVLAALLFGSLLAGPAFAQDFVGAGGGAIPDNNPAGVNVTFNVSGVTGEVRDVRVRVSLTHSWVGDLTATLISPDGLARLRLFGRVGSNRSTGFGDSSDLGGVYEFRDDAPQDFWQAAAAVDASTIIPTGLSNRTSSAGTGNVPAAARSNVGGCSTFLQLAFRGLTGAQVNGTWTLNVADLDAGQTGTAGAAGSVLTIVSGAVTGGEIPILISSFEDGETQPAIPAPSPITASAVRGNCTPGVNSPTGTGLTDFVMVRAIGGGPIAWSVKTNDGTAAGPVLPDFVLGVDSDFFMMGDFDGDGFSDATVWSPGVAARFKVRRSSRPNDLPLLIPLGTTGDDPTVVADFDGDRVTDAAVYRDGTPGDTTARWIVRRSATAAVTDFPISSSDGSIPFSLRDITGDGRADYGIQFNGGAGVGRFRVFSGANGVQIGPFFDFGLSSDFVVPGHSVGSDVTDIAVSRNANPGTGTVKYFFPRDMATGIGDAANLATGIVVGIPGDFITQGDYDGDGLTDYAVWRTSATPGQSKFVLRRSTAVATPLEVFHGQSGDYPVNNWDVH